MRAVILTFPLAQTKAKQTATADEIQAYWDRNKAEFMKDEKVKLRHIVVAANPQGGPEAAAQARAKAESILTEARTGKDFAALAREKSDDASTQARGGDLGWRKKGELIPEYDAVVFRLRKGGVSEIFQTKFGFHIIKCDDRQAEEKPTFAQVKEKIRDKIITARARESLLAEVTRASWSAKRDKDLLKVAERVGRKPIVTSWFEWSKAPPAGLSKAQHDALVKALAGAEAGDHTGVVETDEGWLIAQLLDETHYRADEKGFLRDRAEIEPALVARKQQAAYDAWLAVLREKAKIKRYLDGA
jgi:parvulin-like peptidyl-prolyl isomerase